jgi:predicted alpha/beta-fold hydrolase
MKTKYPYTDSKFTRIARDFKASEFRASWFDNEHYQTIVGSEALRLKVFGSYPREFKTRRESIYTPDGDSFSVDYTLDTMNDSKPIVLVLHGLESNTQGPLVTKMTTAFIQKGFCCCLISFRGCDGTDNNTPGAYHLGFTNDLDFLIKQIINKKYPNKRIYLAGFSLGGNVCLKYLGEMGERATAHNLYGAAVTSVPFDPVASQGKLDKPGFNRQVYSAVGVADVCCVVSH